MAGHTVTSMGKHLDAKSTIRRINLQRKCRKKKYDKHPRPIHPRQDLQEGDDWSGTLWKDHHWDGSACKRKPHSRSHQSRNWRLPWQLVDSLKRGELRYDANKASTWFQEGDVDKCTASRKRRTRSNMQSGHKVPPHGGNGKQTGGSPDYENSTQRWGDPLIERG